jgi:hypothetical protein
MASVMTSDARALVVLRKADVDGWKRTPPDSEYFLNNLRPSN